MLCTCFPPQEAIAGYTEAMEIDPLNNCNNAKLFCNRASACLKLKRWDDVSSPFHPPAPTPLVIGSVACGMDKLNCSTHGSCVLCEQHTREPWCAAVQIAVQNLDRTRRETEAEAEAEPSSPHRAAPHSTTVFESIRAASRQTYMSSYRTMHGTLRCA